MSRAGENRIWGIYGKGSIVFASECMYGRKTECRCTAAQQTTLVRMPAAQLRDAVRHDTGASAEVMRMISLEYEAFSSYARALATKTALIRTCTALKDLAEVFGTEDSGRIIIEYKMNQQFLADFVGVNRVTLAKLIGELKSRRIIETVNGLYAIRDREGIAAETTEVF